MNFFTDLFHLHQPKETAMAVPVVSATLDAPSYAPGATYTLTVVRSDTSVAATTREIAVTETDNVTGEAASLSVTLNVDASATDPTTSAVSDPNGPVTLVSDDGTTAIYTGTA